MAKIKLKRITENNFNDVIALSNTLTEHQKRCVATNLKSLAQAYVHRKVAWPRAIYLGNKPIGFIMLDLKPEDIDKKDIPAYYLWRFMIAKGYQQKGYGSSVLDLIVEKCKKDQIKTLYTSCDIEEDQPLNFYLKYGFSNTQIMDEDELVLKLLII